MTDITNALDTSNELKLDAQAKKIIANKKFLARLLHEYVPEFKKYSADEISEKYIDENSVHVSQVVVERDLTNAVYDDSLSAEIESDPVKTSEEAESAPPANELPTPDCVKQTAQTDQTLSDSVDGIGNEDTTLTEGKITYDVIFKVRYPDKKDELIGMYINVEAQADYHPGYPIETRALYYAARRFASQLRHIDRTTNYGLLQKVYSIWICMGNNVPKKLAGTVTMYHETPEHLVGNAELDPDIYDKIKTIIIRFNDAAKIDDPYLRSLQTLFSRETDRQQKVKALEAQGIRMDPKLEGDLEHMCNYSAYIKSTARQEGLLEGEQKGFWKGERKGRQEGRQEGLQEGRQEGRREGKAETALSMLADHLSYEMISKHTGFTVEEIKKLEQQLAMA